MNLGVVQTFMAANTPDASHFQPYLIWFLFGVIVGGFGTGYLVFLMSKAKK